MKFNSCNNIKPGYTGGRDRPVWKINEYGRYTTRYPFRKYDGHGFTKDQWWRELVHPETGMTNVKHLMDANSLAPNVGDGMHHIVHLITGNGDQVLTQTTMSNLQFMKTQNTIVDFWYDTSKRVPTEFFVLYKRSDNATGTAKAITIPNPSR